MKKNKQRAKKRENKQMENLEEKSNSWGRINR
jgi:hypothetical protein